jgi:hypothetical protein
MKIDTSPINNNGIYNLDFDYYLNYDFDSILQYNSLLNDSIFTTFKANYLDKTLINKNTYCKLQSKIDSLTGDTQNKPFTFTFIDFSSIQNIKELQKKIYIDQNSIFQNFLHYCQFIAK